MDCVEGPDGERDFPAVESTAAAILRDCSFWGDAWMEAASLHALIANISCIVNKPHCSKQYQQLIEINNQN
jgi:hypothetical protein